MSDRKPANDNEGNPYSPGRRLAMGLLAKVTAKSAREEGNLPLMRSSRRLEALSKGLPDPKRR